MGLGCSHGTNIPAIGSDATSCSGHTDRCDREQVSSQGIAPRVLVSDKLCSYSASKDELMLGVEHRSGKA